MQRQLCFPGHTVNNTMMAPGAAPESAPAATLAANGGSLRSTCVSCGGNGHHLHQHAGTPKAGLDACSDRWIVHVDPVVPHFVVVAEGAHVRQPHLDAAVDALTHAWDAAGQPERAPLG